MAKLGRKKMIEEEKLIHRVTISLTQLQMNWLEENVKFSSKYFRDKLIEDIRIEKLEEV